MRDLKLKFSGNLAQLVIDSSAKYAEQVFTIQTKAAVAVHDLEALNLKLDMLLGTENSFTANINIKNSKLSGVAKYKLMI